MGDKMDKFFNEKKHVDALCDDEPKIERQLKPARAENDCREGAQRNRCGGGRRSGRVKVAQDSLLRCGASQYGSRTVCVE